MIITIILPNRTILERQADKITAPGSEGSFQILPKHVDFVSSLKPGILSIFFDGSIEYYAISYGMLVKQSDTVYITCLQAIKGDSLDTLSETVSENFSRMDDNEKRINSILVKMESDTLKRFLELD